MTAPARGTFGDLDLQFGFKPPTGIGLSVDAQGVVTGGGFLFHDPAQAAVCRRDAAVARTTQLTLKAFGLIATSMPDGSPGYSLIVFITAEDFRPIPLGWASRCRASAAWSPSTAPSTRTCCAPACRTTRCKTLLFPRDPVGNAPSHHQRSWRAPSRPRRGSYLLGILARIGWFTPDADPARPGADPGVRRAPAAARARAHQRAAALARQRSGALNLDAIGVLDFDQGTASIDAMLVDSRLAHKFALTGAGRAARRLGLGPATRASCWRSAGSIRTSRRPPACRRSPRVAIALSSGNNPRLICDAYFAITSNTVQFGARRRSSTPRPMASASRATSASTC